jgi:Uma2 family endonuclease
MDKKSDIRGSTSLQAAAPGLNVSCPEPRYESPPASRSGPRSGPPPLESTLNELLRWEDSEDTAQRAGSEEAIFRASSNAAGEFEMQILPQTFDNLTHPKEEDVVTQSNRHYRTLDLVDDILRRQLERKRDGVGVFSDLLVVWDDPSLNDSSPDVFVVFDLKRPPEELEGRFDVAREGTQPSLIFEIVSGTYRDNRRKDYEFNTKHYAKAGVRELVLVEPMSEGSPHIRRLLVLRLGPGGTYREIRPNAEGRFLLKTVGMTVHVEDATVVLCDAATGERFLTSAEEEEARQAEKAARQAAEEGQKTAEEGQKTAEERAQAAEAENRRLLDEIELLKRSLTD